MGAPSGSSTLPGFGPVFHALGVQLTVLLSGEQTGGAFTMVEIVTPPGGGPPPHCHTNEDEWFYILEGRIELWKDGAWTEAPAGFELFFAELSAVCAAPGGPDMRAIHEVAARHGISFINPSGG
jgi:hypothetical protein